MNKSINYITFTTDDFIWDDSFREWVLDADAENEIFWQDYMNSHPEQISAIIAAKEIILSLKVNNAPLANKDIEDSIDYVLSAIHTEDIPDEQQSPLPKSINTRSMIYLSVAASLLLLIGVIFWLNINVAGNSSPQTYAEMVGNADEKLVEKVNNTQAPIRIKLEDGSIVILEKNSKISLPNSFKDRSVRNIYLGGEASFEIAHMINKPFIVYSGGLVTKVLGTKFKVRSYDKGKKTSVEVKSGIVAIYTMANQPKETRTFDRKLNGLILTRNQKANYSLQDQTLAITIVDKPEITERKNIRYNFVETGLAEVFSRIKAGYGIEIIYDKTALDPETLTADLENKNMFDKLNIICKAINSSYEVIDGKIVIYSNKEFEK